ncbi:fibronectin type III domain protein [Cystobacter fuscus]|uniref:Fibronectin type III domain protein n=1 Tax=Cystobacter fuscus TaxID=43 RepID=A0A250J214_9BACT|nr:MXAN_2561 family MXYO-CTERM-anchored protein [Cystobacter fuscus]ATB37421.1 fibronectin type III domain protein [Cystobacter fuscus]
MRTFLLTTALLLSSAASAQVKFTFGTANNETLSFGKADCSNPVTVTWTRTIQPCDRLTLWITTTGSCQGAAADTSKGDVALDEISLSTFQAATQGTFNLDRSRLPFVTSDGGAACGSLNEEKTFSLCGATKQTDNFYGCNSTVVNATAARITYDGKPPSAPTLSATSGMDGAASITVNAPSDATRGVVRILLNGEEFRKVEWSLGKGALLVENLENDVTYEADATVFDAAGNESERSSPVQVIPTKTYGFMEHYGDSGGQEVGCGAVGGGVAGGAMLAVLGFWLFSRRNRSWLEQ